MESFGVLLRRHRMAAVLTQERLAERARISATGIAALEAGRRKVPRPSTVALLLDALDLTDEARAEMIAAAAGVVDTHTATARRSDTARRDVTGNLTWIQQKFPLVGRRDELQALTTAWQEHRRIAVISGEAGAGKTRLVGEFVLSLPGAVTVLWGRCTPDRLGAYEAFVEPVRNLVTANDAADSHAGELARLVPEVALDQGWTVGPSHAEPEVERRLLFNAITQLLRPLGPTVLVLDDAQWADPASMALLTSLVASPLLDHVMIIATVRSTDQSAANAGALAALRRFTTVERIELGGLDDEDLAALVAHVAGGAAESTLVDKVAAATDGNPLFVEELTEHLLAHEPADPAATSLVPVTVRETLAQRITTLSDEAQSLLHAGAVLGRSFDIDVAARLVDLDGEALLAACEDALLSGLVNETNPTRLSFSHALVQSAVYELASARRRLDLHRRAAIHLEQALGATTGTDALVFDIARHWSITAAADSTAAAAAARWAVLAGDAAAAAADIDEAILRYEQADRLWGIGTREHATTLIRLGNALTALGHDTQADERYRAARHVAEGLGDVELYAQAAIGLAATVRYGHSDPERISALERAIDTLDPGDGVLRPTAAAMLKRQLGFESSDDAWVRRQRAGAHRHRGGDCRGAAPRTAAVARIGS